MGSQPDRDLGRYELTGLTETHLRVLNRALEFLFRVGMGQFREVIDVADPTFKRRGKVQDKAEDLLRQVRELLMPDLTHPNSYWSIHAHEISDDYRVACDMHQVVRHRLAWDRNPKGDFTVNFDEPSRSSQRVGLIGIRPDGDQLPPPPAEIVVPELATEAVKAKKAPTKKAVPKAKKPATKTAAKKPAAKPRKS